MVRTNLVNKTQGPAAGNPGAKLRARLAAQGLKLPWLGDDDETADYQFIKQLILSRSKELGRQYGVEYAEKYHYISPEQSHYEKRMEAMVERVVQEQAVPL